MAQQGEEPIGSMGTDTSLAALSDRPRLLYDYFKQLFAQVTNPPLDAIREELVTSMESTIGPEGNLLDPRPESCRQIKIKYPIIDNDQLAKLRHVYDPGFRTIRIPMLFDVREGGVSVAHNPSSNLKLANGIAPVQDLLDDGVNVSLGTDGAASNNNLNLFEEMHLAALLQKWLKRDAEALPAREVLRMATIRGARALGLDGDIGSLEIGKRADVIMIDAAQPHLAPRHDPIALLVYSAQAADVCTVLVDGRILLEDRELCTLDEAALLAQAAEQTRRLLHRAARR